MKKTSLFVAILIHFTIISAYSQSYSTLPPSVVGQPAVAIHSRGNSPQIYQYDTAPTPLPSSTFVYDLNSGRSAIQFNSPGVTLVQPLQNDD